MGLLGALLPVPGGMTWSPGWFGHGKLRAWLACLFARVVERYCFTCCRWACWMWYLVGFSRWVCTCTTQFKKDFIVLRHHCRCYGSELYICDIRTSYLTKHKPVQLQGSPQCFSSWHLVARNQFMIRSFNNRLTIGTPRSSSYFSTTWDFSLKTSARVFSSYRHFRTVSSEFRPSAMWHLVFTKIWRNELYCRTHFTC